MDALLEQAVQGMKKNGFEVVEVRTAAEACDYLLAHIAAEKSVGVGGSVSIRDTGVLPATISGWYEEVYEPDYSTLETA